MDRYIFVLRVGSVSLLPFSLPVWYEFQASAGIPLLEFDCKAKESELERSNYFPKLTL